MPTTQQKTNGTGTSSDRFFEVDLSTYADEEELPPVWFRFAGERFDCLPAPTVGGRRLFTAAIADGRMGVVDCVNAICASLQPEAEERFLAMLERKDLRIPNGAIGDVFNGLLEQYTARPTSPPSS